MNFRTLAVACAAAVSVSFAAGAALADDPVTVKLQSPVAEKTKLIAGGAVFMCEGDTCLAAAPSSQTYGATACKDVAKKVGAVASFGGSRKQLDAAKLDQCNAVALPAQQVANR